MPVRAIALITLAAVLAAQQQPSRSAMQIAEDARLRDSVSLTPLRAGLRVSNPALQALALRGLGRLEWLDVVPELLPSLNSSSAAVRIDAVNALAQAAVGSGSPAAARAAAANQVFDALRARAARETDMSVRAALARSITRLQLTQA